MGIIADRNSRDNLQRCRVHNGEGVVLLGEHEQRSFRSCRLGGLWRRRLRDATAGRRCGASSQSGRLQEAVLYLHRSFRLDEHVLIGDDIDLLTGSASGGQNGEECLCAGQYRGDPANRRGDGIGDQVAGVLDAIDHSGEHVVHAARLTMHAVKDFPATASNSTLCSLKRCSKIGNVGRDRLNLGSDFLQGLAASGSGSAWPSFGVPGRRTAETRWSYAW